MIVGALMVRDEADILPQFLAHACALFDRVLVVDHLSADATPAILAGAMAAGLPVRVWRMAHPGHWQSAVVTTLARQAFAEGAQWVVPIDADEFLDVADRPALEARLEAPGAPVVCFRWRHAVPEADPPPAGPQLRPGQGWLANPAPIASGRGKVAIHRRVAEALPGFRLSAGNHHVIGMAFAKPEQGPEAGILWHLPARGRAQFLAKLRRDLGSYASPDGPPLVEMSDALRVKRRLFEALQAAPADGAMLRRIALRYWEQGEACLDPASPWPDPVAVSPRIAALPLGWEAGVAPPPLPPRPDLPAGTRLARAVLAEGEVRLEPEGSGAIRAVALEEGLRRRLVPGFRLARFVAARLVRWRLAAGFGGAAAKKNGPRA